MLRTSEQLFGNRYAALLHDFPAFLGALVSRTAGAIGDAETIALRHTILGYFLPVREASFGSSTLAGITSGAVSDIKMRLGIPASGIGGYHPLRSCSVCTSEDVKHVGRAIWHVEHQLPSVLVCRRHYRPLLHHWNRATPVHRRDWLSPTDSSTALKVSVANDRTLQMLLRIAEISARFAQCEPGALAGDTLPTLFRRWARSVGGATASTQLRRPFLVRALRPDLDALNKVTRQLPPAGFILEPDRLLAAMSRARPRGMHPFKLNVLLSCMFSDWDEVQVAWTSPGSDTTPQALEDRASRRTNSSRQRTAFLSHTSGGSSVRAAALLVGVSVGTGIRWATQSGVSFRSRAKVLRHAELDALRTDLIAGMDRARAARRAGVSKASVDRLLSVDHELRDKWLSIRKAAARTQYRNSIEAVIRSSDGIRMSQLRKAEPAAWQWLYRNDRPWLMAVLPALWSASTLTSDSAGE